jgi:hypothetical protein
MTKLKGKVTLGRLLVLGTPLILLGACAVPPPPAPPCDACAVAAQAQATANQALATAQQALAAAQASRTTTSEAYQRSLRK